MSEILYAKANFTEFSLRTFSKRLEENYMSEHVDEAFELLCPKCDKNLTETEYLSNKLQQTQIGRKIKATGHKYNTSDTEGDEIVIYSMEHKRCSKK